MNVSFLFRETARFNLCSALAGSPPSAFQMEPPPPAAGNESLRMSLPLGSSWAMPVPPPPGGRQAGLPWGTVTWNAGPQLIRFIPAETRLVHLLCVRLSEVRRESRSAQRRPTSKHAGRRWENVGTQRRGTEGEVPPPEAHPSPENPRSDPPAELRSRELVPTCSAPHAIVLPRSPRPHGRLTGGLAGPWASLHSVCGPVTGSCTT